MYIRNIRLCLNISLQVCYFSIQFFKDSKKNIIESFNNKSNKQTLVKKLSKHNKYKRQTNKMNHSLLL